MLAGSVMAMQVSEFPADIHRRQRAAARSGGILTQSERFGTSVRGTRSDADEASAWRRGDRRMSAEMDACAGVRGAPYGATDLEADPAATRYGWGEVLLMLTGTVAGVLAASSLAVWVYLG
jgi:hypothetical protein